MENELIFDKIANEDKIAFVLHLKKNVLGGSEALEFSSIVRTFINDNPYAVVINMEETEIINSSGLGMLVSGLSTLKKYNIPLFLCAVPDKVKQLLEMTHLDRVFKMFPDINSAIID